MLIDFICDENTSYFGNECGCGCEQSLDCPKFIDCTPGPSGECTNELIEACPYSTFKKSPFAP